MAKKKRSTPTKTTDNLEEPIVEAEPEVTPVEEVIPESPEPETPEPEETVVEEVTEEIVEGMVRLEILKGSVGFQIDQQYEVHEEGEVITVPAEVAERLDPQFIKVLK